MINIYLPELHALQSITLDKIALLQQAVWIDLLNPSKEEEHQVENFLGISIPTRTEMQEIELSSRLYQDNENLFLTALVIANSDSKEPKIDPISIILTPKYIITVRYIEPQAFNLFLINLKKISPSPQHPITFFIELLDTIIDRLADILEFVGHNLDTSSQIIFHPKNSEKVDYKKILQHIGSQGDLDSKVRESLITFNRVITFFIQTKSLTLNETQHSRLINFSKDVYSLSDHADFLGTKVTFLLDATLGMVNIEQNNTIRIVSIVSILFLPPTLIASIYGMNFKFQPELSWGIGYPLALLLMLLAAWLPYKYFKKRGWL